MGESNGIYKKTHKKNKRRHATGDVRRDKMDVHLCKKIQISNCILHMSGDNDDAYGASVECRFKVFNRRCYRAGYGQYRLDCDFYSIYGAF